MGERGSPSVLVVDPPLSDEILDLEEFAFREAPVMINELVRSRIPADLRPHQPEVHAFTLTIFQAGVELLLQRYASRSTSSMGRNSTSSTLMDRPSGSSNTDSGIGGATSHRQNDASQIFRSRSAVPDASNWASEQFSQGLGVGTEADHTYSLNGFDIPMDWNFDESWPNSGTL